MRNSKLTSKDMSVLREADKTKDQSKKRYFPIRDYSLQHHVSIHIDLNDEAQKDMMFRLKIDDQEVILDSEEVLRALRWI